MRLAREAEKGIRSASLDRFEIEVNSSKEPANGFALLGDSRPICSGIGGGVGCVACGEGLRGIHVPAN